jgi:hypothetical protein
MQLDTLLRGEDQCVCHEARPNFTSNRANPSRTRAAASRLSAPK